MKKWIALLIALMMTVLCTMALAEEETESAVSQEAIKLYSSEWADGYTSAKIYAEEDHWHVWITSADGTVKWDYDCLYDEEQKTLVSIDGAENIKTEITIDEEGSEIDWAEIYNDGKAVFSLNEDGKLIWKDEIKDEGAGLAFEKIGWFQGIWVAGEDLESRYELNCYWDVEEPTEGEVYSGYKVEIIRHENETITFWSYACAYNAETDTLESALGVKEFSGEEGEPFTVVYEDGAAVFFFNDEGCIIWQDENENAGEGLQFNATNG